MRSMLVFLLALMVSVLGCLPRAQASGFPAPADRARELLAGRSALLLDAYLTDERPEAVVVDAWRPVWIRWEKAEAARRDYDAALIWGEVAREDDALVEAYCQLLEVLPERPSLAPLREPALCAEVSP